jgi:hypothetical protein
MAEYKRHVRDGYLNLADYRTPTGGLNPALTVVLPQLMAMAFRPGMARLTARMLGMPLMDLGPLSDSASSDSDASGDSDY